MQKLTGYQRCVLTMLWLKTDKSIDRETYIKKVCKAKNIEYVPPSKTDRPEVKKLANQ